MDTVKPLARLDLVGIRGGKGGGGGAIIRVAGSGLACFLRPSNLTNWAIFRCMFTKVARNVERT